jgi:hypothetical protein
MPERESSKLETKIPVPDFYVAARSIDCVLRLGAASLVIVSLDSRIFVVLIIGHLKGTLEVHLHGSLMMIMGILSSLMASGAGNWASSEREKTPDIWSDSLIGRATSWSPSYADRPVGEHPHRRGPE